MPGDVEILRGLQLGLAGVRGVDRIVLPRQGIQPLDGVLRHDRLASMRVGEGLAGAPAVEASEPFGEGRRPPPVLGAGRGEVTEPMPANRDDGPVAFYHLTRPPKRDGYNTGIG